MARFLVPSIVPIPTAGKKIILGDKVIGITIRNNSTSDANLLVGVNSDDCTEVLEPGQELSIGGFASSEPYYLDAYFMCQWESGSTKNASYTLLKDGSKDKCK